MSESQHRRGDAQDRTGVRQTRPSGTRQARPSGANGTRRPSSSGNPKKRRKRRKKRSVNSRIGKVLLIVVIVIAFAGCRRNSGYGVRYSAKHGYAEYLRCSARFLYLCHL